MTISQKKIESYPVDTNLERVNQKLAQKINGDTDNRVKNNTLCKKCK